MGWPILQGSSHDAVSGVEPQVCPPTATRREASVLAVPPVQPDRHHGLLARLSTLQQAKDLAARCLAEYDQAVAAGAFEKRHRVCHYLLREGSSLRAQLQVELLSYSLMPCVCRRITAVHSSIMGFKRKATNLSIPMIAAKSRRLDTKVALAKSSFKLWLDGKRNRRDIVRRSLICILSYKGLGKMTMKQVLGWWYQRVRR